jgi:hypothetical protein
MFSHATALAPPHPLPVLLPFTGPKSFGLSLSFRNYDALESFPVDFPSPSPRPLIVHRPVNGYAKRLEPVSPVREKQVEGGLVIPPIGWSFIIKDERARLMGFDCGMATNSGDWTHQKRSDNDDRVP